MTDSSTTPTGPDHGERNRLAALAGQGAGMPAVPAATVIPIRDGVDGPEILMLRRDSRLAFAGGLWVFPGGRVDPTDYPNGGPTDDPTDLAHAEVAAAAREATEEAGLSLNPATFVRLSHWTPPPQSHKRYSTAFFVAPLVGERPDVVIDDSEIRAHQWVSPAGALDLHAAGEIELAPPTYITLLQLDGFAETNELIITIDQWPVEHFSTRIGLGGDRIAALFHGDVAYDDGDHTPETMNRPGPRHRLWLDNSGWIYERE